MNTIKIIIPEETAIKKNGMRKLYARKDKGGRLVPLKFPLVYYTPKYTEYAKGAVLQLVKIKDELKKNPRITLPLKGKFVVSFLFFMKRQGTIDLSNMYEAPQDLLGANTGIESKLPKNLKNGDLYRILFDDSSDIIVNHGASRVFHDPANPRTEIFISEFTNQKWQEVFKIWHGDAKVGDDTAEETLFGNEQSLSLGDIL
jgi:hypothetical protein